MLVELFKNKSICPQSHLKSSVNIATTMCIKSHTFEMNLMNRLKFGIELVSIHSYLLRSKTSKLIHLSRKVVEAPFSHTDTIDSDLSETEMLV